MCCFDVVIINKIVYYGKNYLSKFVYSYRVSLLANLQAFAALRIHAPGGFSFSRYLMKRKTAIKSSSLPARSPLGTAILLWLLLDYTGAPGWAFGVMWTLVAVLAISWIHCLLTTTELDVPGFGEK